MATLQQKTETLHLLARISTFPTERMQRCGATPAQIATEQANWATHTLDWQAQEAHYLRSLSDATITTMIASWPPAVPPDQISAWPFQ